MKNTISVIIALIIGIVAGYFWGINSVDVIDSEGLAEVIEVEPKNETVPTPPAKKPSEDQPGVDQPEAGKIISESASGNLVMVFDQNAGGLVQLEKVSVTQNSWIAVLEDREGVPGNILGAQRFDAGIYENGMVELLRGMVSGNVYYVMIYADNGDRVFDHKVDTLIDGGKIFGTFKAL